MCWIRSRLLWPNRESRARWRLPRGFGNSRGTSAPGRGWGAHRCGLTANGCQEALAYQPRKCRFRTLAMLTEPCPETIQGHPTTAFASSELASDGRGGSGEDLQLLERLRSRQGP